MYLAESYHSPLTPITRDVASMVRLVEMIVTRARPGSGNKITLEVHCVQSWISLVLQRLFITISLPASESDLGLRFLFFF